MELGKSDDFTGDRRNAFVAGLKEVLQSVRARKIRDFNAIAKEIIEYRQQFLGDKSRILASLDGIAV